MDKVKGKVGEALRANLSSVVLNRQLTEMVRDVPLPYTPDQLELQPWDREKIHPLFDDLEFRLLRDRLFETLASVEPEAEEGFDVRGGIVAPGALDDWLEGTRVRRRRTACPILGPRTPLTVMRLPSPSRRPTGKARYFDDVGLDAAGRARAGGLARRCRHPKAVHEAKAAVHALRGRGWPLGRIDQRHRPGRLSGPAGAAHVQSGRSVAAVPVT